jgi:hypothetical protein
VPQWANRFPAHCVEGFADSHGWAKAVPSAVALQVVRLACERPDSLGLATLSKIAQNWRGGSSPRESWRTSPPPPFDTL